jgi:hypothetical protein
MVANGDSGPLGSFNRLPMYLSKMEPSQPKEASSEVISSEVTEATTTGNHSFWQDQFRGLLAPQYPSMPHPTYKAKIDHLVDHVVENIEWSKLTVDGSSLIQTALAILISWSEDTQDTVFGVEVPGSGLLGTADIDCRALVPLRVLINREETIEKLMSDVERHMTEMRGTSVDRTTLQRIRLLGPEAERAASFRTTLVGRLLTATSGGMTMEDVGDDQAIVIGYRMEESALHLQVATDSTVVPNKESLMCVFDISFSSLMRSKLFTRQFVG